MNTEIPHLKIERLENGCVRLENESMGESYCVDVHPLHLRYIAEKLGLMPAASDAEANAHRMVDKLARRIKILQSRITFLDEQLWLNPDPECADITGERIMSDALVDLVDEFVQEIDESGAVVTPMSREFRDNTPKSGGLPSAPKAGVFEPSPNPGKTQRVSESGMSSTSSTSTEIGTAKQSQKRGRSPAQMELAQ